jgi:hypothetical protein
MPMLVEVTLCLMAEQHDLQYVAFTQTWSRTFTREARVLYVDKVLNAEQITDPASPYIIDGVLKGRLFLKIRDFGPHLLEEVRKEGE